MKREQKREKEGENERPRKLWKTIIFKKREREKKR